MKYCSLQMTADPGGVYYLFTDWYFILYFVPYAAQMNWIMHLNCLLKQTRVFHLDCSLFVCTTCTGYNFKVAFSTFLHLHRTHLTDNKNALLFLNFVTLHFFNFLSCLLALHGLLFTNSNNEVIFHLVELNIDYILCIFTLSIET